MKLKHITIISVLICIFFSCNIKKENIVNINQDIIENNSEVVLNMNSPEMIHSIEYYKNEIIKYEDKYYGFQNISMEIGQLMNISQIVQIDNFVPNLLTFLVSWYNMKGYIFYLYTFDNNQNIIRHYYCGDLYPFENHKVLMEKLSGNIFEYGNIAIGDYNNDGINEIILFSQYKNIGFVFIVYGFDFTENKLKELLLVPVFINFDKPFPSVEYIENGFKILEVIDDENMELVWNKYIWDKRIGKYLKE
jgi:hypothetical protein